MSMTTRSTRDLSGRVRTPTLAAMAALGGLCLGLGGCSNAVEGGLSGAAGGALIGMGLGSLTGDMGKGAAAGALIGGLGGAIIGDQNRRADERAGYDRGGSGYYYQDRSPPRYRGREHYSPYPY